MIKFLEEIHRSFKRDNYFLTITLKTVDVILERKEYLPKMNNLPNHHGAGPQ